MNRTGNKKPSAGIGSGDEIGNYPPPIAGCDAQFNYLLEERARIARELDRLKAETGLQKAELIERWAKAHSLETPVILDDRREIIYED